MMSRNLLIASICSLLLAGCGSTSNKGTDYRSQGGKIPSLEVPPDLTSPIADDRFVIPDSKATTYSTYNRERSNAPATGNAVLPKVENARIERVGEQRWLIVKASPEQVWPTIKSFWLESGFLLKRESPEAGIMETDWAEDRLKIPQDAVRRTVGRVLDGMYETGIRDKFRTRIEVGAVPGTTEIYISHRGAEEVYSNTDQLSTSWQARPADKELEAGSSRVGWAGRCPTSSARPRGRCSCGTGTRAGRGSRDTQRTQRPERPWHRSRAARWARSTRSGGRSKGSRDWRQRDVREVPVHVRTGPTQEPGMPGGGDCGG